MEKATCRRIGLFGGTFDPVHLGHLQIAVSLWELAGLDEVWWIPAFHPPLRDLPLASWQDRCEMCRRAIAPFPFFSLLTCEGEREGPSYAIDTVRELIREDEQGEQKHTYFFLLADELIPTLSKWKDVAQLFHLAPPLVGRRLPRPDAQLVSGIAEVDQLLEGAIYPTRCLEIAATEIRERLEENKPIAHLLPESVVQYIQEDRLYV